MHGRRVNSNGVRRHLPAHAINVCCIKILIEVQCAPEWSVMNLDRHNEYTEMRCTCLNMERCLSQIELACAIMCESPNLFKISI
jgi:hypothetical protein